MSSSLWRWTAIAAIWSVTILLGAFLFDFQRPSAISLASADKATAAPIMTSLWSPPSVVQDGIEIAISRLERTNGQTRLIVEMNNHQYDLTAIDVKAVSTLNGLSPSLYTILSGASGGHHVEAELLFETETAGELVIGLDAERRFTFQLL